MRDRQTKLILESYEQMLNPRNKFQQISEAFWDDVYIASTVLNESSDQQLIFEKLEENVMFRAMCMTEAELPEFFKVLEEGWKDKLKAIGKGAANLAGKAAKATGNVIKQQALNKDSAFNKVGDFAGKATGKLATAAAKGAVKVGKAVAKGAAAMGKELIPDEWQKKGKEIIDKVKNKLAGVYNDKIKPAMEAFGKKLKAMGNVLVPPETAERIITSAKNNPTFKKFMSKMGGDNSEKSIGTYLSQTLKDNKGSLIAAVAALAFPPANMWVGAKIAATVLIPIIMDSIIAFQKFKEEQVKYAKDKLKAKTVGDYLNLKKQGELKKIKEPKQLGSGQSDMLPA